MAFLPPDFEREIQQQRPFGIPLVPQEPDLAGIYQDSMGIASQMIPQTPFGNADRLGAAFRSRKTPVRKGKARNFTEGFSAGFGGANASEQANEYERTRRVSEAGSGLANHRWAQKARERAEAQETQDAYFKEQRQASLLRERDQKMADRDKAKQEWDAQQDMMRWRLSRLGHEKDRLFDIRNPLPEKAGIDRRFEEREQRDKVKRQHGALGRLTDDVRADVDFKDMQVIRDFYEQGIKHAQEKSSGGDIALMRAVARATDPRTGVREEEYRTFADAQGSLSRMGIKWTNQMVGRGMLTDYGRAQMVRILENAYDQKFVPFDDKRKMYGRQAEFEEIDPELVLGGFRGIQPRARRSGPSAGMVRMKAPDGRILMVPQAKVEQMKGLGATPQ